MNSLNATFFLTNMPKPFLQYVDLNKTYNQDSIHSLWLDYALPHTVYNKTDCQPASFHSTGMFRVNITQGRFTNEDAHELVPYAEPFACINVTYE